jgi:hypothetical protein
MDASRYEGHTPEPWEAYDPCFGTCPIGGMPCTPEGCFENHPVGEIAVSGPPTYDEGELLLLNPADARLIADAPAILAARDRLAAELAASQAECERLTRERAAFGESAGAEIDRLVAALAARKAECERLRGERNELIVVGNVKAVVAAHQAGELTEKEAANAVSGRDVWSYREMAKLTIREGLDAAATLAPPPGEGGGA